MKNFVNVTIDGSLYKIGAEQTILEGCREIGIKLPSLCYLEDVSSNASCAICLVEVKGAKTLLRSCITELKEGMEIVTYSPEIDRVRKINLELILANHPKDCLICERNGNCELQELSALLGAEREFSYSQTYIA
ncbi:MAG: 2Fe-2S iron-sulfur cluster-binding protein [Bacteroidales bacterium]